MKIFLSGDVTNQFEDNQFISSSLQKIIREANLSICNFEGVVANHNCKAQKMMQRANTPRLIKEAGFDLCLLSNNHITDCGKTGIISTIEALENVNLQHIGADLSIQKTYSPYVTTIDENRICIINVCEAQEGHYVNENQEYGYAWMGHSLVEDMIKKQVSLSDFVIVCVHAGLEHVDMPLPQFRDIYRHYCDLGVNCVIAAHPHIAQGIEVYNGALICYSLGNFYFPRTVEANYVDPENCSYSILIDFSKNQMKYEIIYHRIENHIVELCSKEDVNFDINYLSSSLDAETYNLYMESNINYLYEKYALNHFLYVFRGTLPSDNLKSKIKYLCKYLLNKGDYYGDEYGRQRQILRLMENETYRFLTITAMKQKIKSYENN